MSGAIGEVPAGGWYVEILVTATNEVLRPTVLDGAEVRPTLNGLPECRIPVPKNEGWLELISDGEPTVAMKVWKNGERKAIEVLDDVEQQPDRSVLVGRGGVELRERITTSYQRKLAHEATKDIVDTTSYARNVDTPPSSTRDDVQVQSASGATDLQNALRSPLTATDPITTTADGLQLAQSCYFFEGEDGGTGGTSTVSNSNFSAESGLSIPAGESVTFTFNPDYRWPADNVNMAVRVKWPGTSTAEFSVAGDTVEVGDGGPFANDVDWFSDLGSGIVLSGGTSSDNEYGGGDLAQGTNYSAEVAVTSGDPVEVDCIAVYDDRFAHTFDDTVDSDGYLSNPMLYPPGGFELVFDDVATAFNVVGGKVDIGLANFTGDDVVGLSNDRGQSYNTATNPGLEFETTFSSVGAYLRWKIKLAPRGTRDTASPTQGIFGQELEDYTLSADLEEIPILTDVQYDTTGADILNQIAELSYSIWEVRWDDAAGGIVVEWTRPGQRTRDSDADVDDYSFSRSVAAEIGRLTVKGSALSVEAEEFTADHGNSTTLEHTEIVPGREVVRDPDTGEIFDAGVDYDLLAQAGLIVTLADGDMVDGDTYEIDYQWTVEGSAETDTYDGTTDREAVRQVTGLTTGAACTQAATWALRQVDSPLDEATVTLARSDRTGPLVEEVDVGALPTDETLSVKSVEQGPATVRLELGSRRSIDEVIGDLQSRIRATAQRV